MSDADLFKHYKRTDRLETLRFWIGSAELSPELAAGFQAFYLTVSQITIKPAEFDRQFENLKGAWRRESNAKEREAHLNAGDIFVSGFWKSRDHVVVVPTLFEHEEGAA